MAEVQNGIKGAVITIKIVGIGGGGNNVLRRLAKDGFDRNQLLAINTILRFSILTCILQRSMRQVP